MTTTNTTLLPWQQSLGSFLAEVIQRDPDKTFLEISGQRITYHDFDDAIKRTAGMFQAAGIRHGDRVCLFLPNCPEFMFCWFGLSLIGAISVPINTAYKRDEAAYILNNAGASALVTHTSLLDTAQAAAALAPDLQHKLLVLAPAQEASDPDWPSFTHSLATATPIDPLPPVSPDDISMLVYTSGTTGNPKGVMLTHQMYVASGQGFAHWTEATSDDRFFTCLPFFHANAQYYSTMGTLAAGATLVVEERFSASRFWDQVRNANATVVNFIGMMMPVLSKQPESPLDRHNSVRLFYGSPSFDPPFLQAFQDRFATDIIVGFGMTECCYGAIEKIGDTRRPNSSGQPRQHPDPRFRNEVAIVDDDGNPLPTGQPGEIVLRNPAVTPGYWRLEDQTRETLQDGWLHTGDMGRLDDDGFLYFVDRKKDVIRRRGENISSQEVEDTIKAHPSVLDCAVIAVPSELGEDEVKAYLTPRPGSAIDPEQIVHWCAARLAYFKVPRYYEVRDDLPRTPSMRVRKDILRRERDDLTQDSFDREQANIRIR